MPAQQIRARLGVRSYLIALIVIAVVPMIPLAIGLVAWQSAIQRGAFEESLLQTSLALSVAVDRQLDTHRVMLETLAEADELKTGDIDGFHALSARVADRHGAVFISFFDTTGKQIFNTLRPPGAPLPTPFKDPRVTLDSPDHPPVGDPRSLQKVIDSGRPLTSDLLFGLVAGRLIFIINIPVWRDGKVAYVLNAAFAPDEMTRLLHESPQFRNVPAAIFDRNGFIVGRWQNADRYVGKRVTQHQLERLKNRGDGIGTGETLEGLPLYYSYARSPTTGWGVWIGVERAAIENEIQGNWIIATALASGGLALGVLMAFFLASRLRRSIEDLAEAAARSEPPRLSGLRTRELTQLEQALKDAAALREAQAQERESRLVAEARKVEAEAASRTKDHFIAVLSHELRNPLAPVRSAVHLLRELNKDRKDGRMNEIIDMLDRQSRQLTRLVSDLLDVSRISSGKIVLKRERVDLCAVARHAAESAMPGVEARNHRFSCDMPQKPMKVMGDFARLSQVVSNLLDNAVKYTPRGGTIRLSVRAEAGFAVLSVEDNGRGIEPAMQPVLFTGIVRSPESDGPEQGGLGLGLPLSRSLVELHGGALEADSEGKDKGSRFTMRIPLADESQAEAGDGIVSDSSAAPHPDERRRVLIVDDNVDAAIMLDRLLQALGHETMVANDGAAALTVARDFRPDVALIDIGMPGMDGYEVARHLRALPANGALRIVAVTGWGQESDRAKSKAAGFDMHLVKPVDAEQLAQAVAGRGMPSGSSR